MDQKEEKQIIKEKENIYYLSMQEINKIINHARNQRDRLILRLLVTTGIRRFELCNLLVQDVNFKDKSIFVRRAKNNKPRSVPIDDKLMQEIRFYIGSRQYGRLIKSNKKSSEGIDESRINAIVRTSAERAGIK
ncbi:tyrosine-type recombinase/integrase, partial [Candidatus Woesearchaeota archaeon]|nr:tyrosine-type recombinase/integrase [Candidatus Woesearchaeota archaeon]